MAERRPEAEVYGVFLERRSLRALTGPPLAEGELAALFEAARWAPSARNEQPWLLLWADEGEELELFRSLVEPGNRRWSDAAPALAFLLTRRHYAANGQENRWAAFDAGAAWMSLALEAARRGLVAHPMGGFDRARAHVELGVPEDRWDILVAIAIGRPGDAAALPEDLRAREVPTPRRPLAEVARKGRLSG